MGSATGTWAPARRMPLSGGRWHLQHGPIDIVLQAEGDPAAVELAHADAWAAFQPLLATLVAELRLLRQPVAPLQPNPLQGEVARRMWDACAPLQAAAQGFITPMAAVAGAVAQQLVAHYRRPGIHRAWVNNGGDIALHLAPGASARVGLVADLAAVDVAALAALASLACAASSASVADPAAAPAGALQPDMAFTLQAADGVGGVATSGWRGRSLSLGMADSVTVLATTAAQADAAATVVGNAVNTDDGRIQRAPASSQRDDSDLGERLVTVAVPPLPAALVRQALHQGLACAVQLQRQGLLQAALLVCQGQVLRLPLQPRPGRPPSTLPPAPIAHAHPATATP